MIDTISISGACEATGFSERQLRSYEKTGLYQTAHQDHQRCIKIPPIFCGTYPLYQTVQKISGSGLHVAYWPLARHSRIWGRRNHNVKIS